MDGWVGNDVDDEMNSSVLYLFFFGFWRECFFLY